MSDQALIERLMRHGNLVAVDLGTGPAPTSERPPWALMLGAVVLSASLWWQVWENRPVHEAVAAPVLAPWVEAVQATLQVTEGTSDLGTLMAVATEHRSADVFEELLREAIHRGQSQAARAVLTAWTTSGTPGLHPGEIDWHGAQWAHQAWQRLSGAPEGPSFDAWQGPGFVLGNADRVIVHEDATTMMVVEMDTLALPEGWVRHKLDEGWSTEDLGDYWQDMMMLGDGQHERWAKTGPATQWTGWQASMTGRQQAQKALAEVKTPADWQAYRQSWPARLDTMPDLVSQAGWPLLNGVAWNPQWERRRMGEISDGDEGMHRAWQAHAWSQPVWDWEQLQTRHAYPVAPDLATAEAWLDEAMAETGLGSFHWPASTPSTPEALSWLAHELRRINTELHAVTGWSGPVLGLGGRVHLDVVQATEEGADGQMLKIDLSSRGESGIALITVVAHPDGMGPVAHEWLHALEILAGDYRLLPDGTPHGTHWGPSNTQFMPQQEALRQGVLAPVTVQADRQAQAAAFVARWAQLDQKADLADLLTLAGTWMSPHHPQRAQAQAWVRQQLDEGNPLPYGGDALALLDAAQSFDANPVLASAHAGAVGDQQPWWVHLSTQEDEGRHRAYWSDPAEMTARAFEAQWQPGMAGSPEAELGSGYDDLSSYSLLAPTALDVAHHQPAWNAFFADLAPWWTAQAQAGTPSLGQRLRDRRNTEVPVVAATAARATMSP